MVQVQGQSFESIQVSVSEDKMKAHLKLDPRADNLSFTIEQLKDILKSHGIRYGLLEDKLESIAHDPQAFAFQTVLIAEGTPPKQGKDGFIRYLFQTSDDNTGPSMLEDGRVDYREVRKINNVRQGQIIAERVLAIQGEPGMTVTGEQIQPQPVKDVYFKPGKNVVLDEERLRLYAVIDGMVTFTDNDRVNVFPVFEVNGDVDYRSGNIDFVGNVVIRGNIITGFTVRAAGDIRVTGSVEGAEVTASGSIDIAGGIVAHNKGFVKAGQSIRCSFIQDARVEAGEDLVVSQSIMHSTVRAGRQVICNGSKGLIVGGVVQAGETVIARTVGNMSYTPTSIEVGINPELRNELNQLYANLRQLGENLDKTDKAIRLLEQMAQVQKLPQDKEQLLGKLKLTRQQITEQQTTAADRIQELERVLEGVELSKVEVHGTVFGGTRIVIGRYTRYVKDAAQRVEFRLEDGEVSMHGKL